MTAMSLFSATLATTMLLCAWLALGWTIIRPVVSRLLPSERFSLAVLAGAGMMGVGLFVIGLGRFSPLIVVAFAMAACLPLWSARVRGQLVATWHEIQLPSLPVALPLAGLFIVLVLAGLALPIGDIGNDGISYHLLGPVVWLREHRIVPVLDMAPTAFPAALETVFGAAMALSNERAPGLCGSVLCLAVLVQVHGVARWLGASARWAEAASLLVACVPILVAPAPSAFVDLEYAGFALASVRLLFTPTTARALAGPLFLGLAMATKYNGLLLTVATLAIAGVYQVSSLNASVRSTLTSIFVGAVSAFALGAPFLLRNWVILGNPIYPPLPFLATLLPPKAFSMAASIDFQKYIQERGKGFGRGPLDFLVLPWRLTFYTAQFHGAGGFGIAPLAFLPAAIVAKWSRTLGYVLAWAAVNTLIWFVVQQEARFLVPVLLLAIAAAVTGAEAMAEGYPRLGRLGVGAVLLVSVGYGAALEAKSLVPAALSTLSTAREAARQHNGVPYLNAFAFLNGLPDPCRVLILSPTVPPFYLRKDYLKIRGGYGEQPVQGVGDATTALSKLNALQITHVLDVSASAQSNASVHDRFRVPLPTPSSLELVFQADDARVYRVIAH